MLYIEYLMRSRNLSVKDLASECGVTRCTMHHYLTGFRFPNTDNFMAIASVLGITAEELYKNWYKEVKE